MPQLERRAFQRLPVGFDVSVIEERCVEADRARLVDLSWGGAFLKMAYPAPVGKTARILFRDTMTGEPITIPGRVIRATSDGIGIRFLEIDATVRATLRRILTTLAPAHGNLPAEIDTLPNLPVQTALRTALQARLAKQAG